MKTFISGVNAQKAIFNSHKTSWSATVPGSESSVEFSMRNTSASGSASDQPYPSQVFCSNEDGTESIKALLSHDDFVFSTYIQKCFGVSNLQRLSWLLASSQLRDSLLDDEGKQEFSTLLEKIADRLNNTILESDPVNKPLFSAEVLESLNLQYQNLLVENELFLDLTSSDKLALVNSHHVVSSALLEITHASCAIQPQAASGATHSQDRNADDDSSAIRNVRYSDWEILNSDSDIRSRRYCSRNTFPFYSPSNVFDEVNDYVASANLPKEWLQDIKISKYRKPIFVNGNLLTDISVSIENLHDYGDFVTTIPSSVLDQLDIIDLPNSDSLSPCFSFDNTIDIHSEASRMHGLSEAALQQLITALRRTSYYDWPGNQIIKTLTSPELLPPTPRKIRAIKLSRLFRGGTKPVTCAFKSVTVNQIRSGNSLFAISVPVKLWNEAGTELVEKKYVFLGTLISNLRQTERSCQWIRMFTKALAENDSTKLESIFYPERRIEIFRTRYPEITKFIHDDYMPVDDTAFAQRQNLWDGIEGQFIENNNVWKHLFSEPEDSVSQNLKSSMIGVLKSRAAGSAQVQRLNDQKDTLLRQIHTIENSVYETEEYKNWLSASNRLDDISDEIATEKYYISRDNLAIEDYLTTIEELKEKIERAKSNIEKHNLNIEKCEEELISTKERVSETEAQYLAARAQNEEQVKSLTEVAERIEQKIEAVQMSSIPEGLVEQREKALENFMEANSIEIFKFDPDTKELTFAINKPVAISINRHAAENSEETRTVYGGPYMLQLRGTSLEISALNPSTLFGFMQDSDSSIVLHPHSPEVPITGDRQFDKVSTCTGSAASAISSGWNSGDIAVLLQAVMAWVTSAVSTDEWGRKYKYLPKKVRLEESEPEQDENVQVQAQ
jgi:predicted  nucleic acid-binding Zn-ribbon protein